MARVSTGETFSFLEGNVFIYASASGSTSGSGIGFCQDVGLTMQFGWREHRGIRKRDHMLRAYSSRVATLTVGHMYCDRTMFALCNGSADVNAKFEGITTGV